MGAVADLITSVRAQIPDKVTGGSSTDGTAFTAAELLQWVNDAATLIAGASLCIKDWFAIPSEKDQDVYELPNHILDVDQLWYDLWPCTRAPELDALFVSKISSRSYFFGPHAQHETPRLHVWPAADRDKATTTLNGAITATTATITLTATTNFKAYGYVMIENELILYRTLDTTNLQLKQTLRGQGGTVAASHVNATTVTERNIFFKCSRLPVAITASTDGIELPRLLWPLVELYMLSKCRNAEQEYGEARAMMRDFDRSIETLAQKAGLKGLRQGLQVRTQPQGPGLWFGRVYVP